MSDEPKREDVERVREALARHDREAREEDAPPPDTAGDTEEDSGEER